MPPAHPQEERPAESHLSLVMKVDVTGGDNEDGQQMGALDFQRRPDEAVVLVLRVHPGEALTSEVCYLCAEERSNAFGITDLLIHRRF